MVLDACTPTILWIGAERPWRQLARSASPLAPSEQERLYAPDLAEAARLIHERARLGRPVAAAVISPDLARVADAAALAPLWAADPGLRILMCRGEGGDTGLNDPRLRWMSLPARPAERVQAHRRATSLGAPRGARAGEPRAPAGGQGAPRERVAPPRRSPLPPICDRAPRRARGPGEPPPSLRSQAALMDRLAEEVRRCHQLASHRFSLLLVDVPRLRRAGLSTSEEVDRMLMELGGSLLRWVRQGDLVARLDSGGLALVLPGVGDPEAVRAVGRRLLDEARQRAGKSELAARLDLGAVIGSHRYERPGTLLRDAWAALVRGGDEGGVNLFDPRAQLDARMQAELEMELLGAEERGELHLQYQPIASLATRRVVGFEAQLRWQHPRLGEVPSELLKAAIQGRRQARPLTAWAVGQGLRDLRSFDEAAGGAGLLLSLDVTRQALVGPDFTRDVADALTRHGVEPWRLGIEIAGSAAEGDAEARVALEALRALGVRVLLDDFAMGQGLLWALSRIPVDGLKIERGVLAAARCARGVALLRGVVGVGRALGLTLVADGVEAPDELELVSDLGCDHAQGFYISRAVGREAAVLQLRERSLSPLSLLAS